MLWLVVYFTFITNNIVPQVLVVDKPSPPVGPLDCSDITPDTCTLSWKPPLDDGGSPITNYIVEKLDNTGVCILFENNLKCKVVFEDVWTVKTFDLGIQIK